MNRPAVIFDHVSKYFPLYSTTSGIKNFLFHLPSAIKEMRSARFWALKDISFEIRRGETFGVMGRNGAGKSTMLSLIADVLKPSKGEVTINGRISPLLEPGSGFHPDLTGRENIILNAVLLGMTKREAITKLDEIIDFAELNGFIDQPIKTYSSGMLARLGFSVAVHRNPEILLIDEILSVGDAQFQKKCTKKMLSFKENGVTIVIVSHNEDILKKICDRTAVIERGKLQSITETGKEY